MKRGGRLKVTPTPLPARPADDRDAARRTLRDLSRLVAVHDPEVLAGLAKDVDRALTSCSRIQDFFRRYIAALKSRVVH